ncbi:MAG: hypothetical protein ACO1OB_13690 [Archangium sp.]
MGGLAIAIGLAMIFMLVVPVVVLVLIAKRFGAVPMVIALVLGVVIGLVAITATFFESTWSPPLKIEFEGTTEQTYVIVIPDENAPPIAVTGSKLPLMQQTTKLQVPASGIVRVRSLEPLFGDMSMNATYRGKSITGMASVAEGMVFDFNSEPIWVDYSELIKKRLAE